MGQIQAVSSRCVDVSNIPELAGPFTVMRSNGEEEDGWMLCKESLEWNAVMDGHFDKAQLLADKALASWDMHSREPRPEFTERSWRIFTINRKTPSESGSLSAWRSLSKMRPTGMSPDDAVEWRRIVVEALDTLDYVVARDE
jgi:hypothetical protein